MEKKINELYSDYRKGELRLGVELFITVNNALAAIAAGH